MTHLLDQSSAVTRPLRWRSKYLRPFVYFLIAVQVVQALLVQVSDFALSYWLVSYDDGFVRRGLSGQIVQLLTGEATNGAATVASLVVGIIPALAIVALIEALMRRHTASSAALAILIAASPFTLDQMLSHRRPDQLGLALVIAVGFAAVFIKPGGTRRLVFATAGVGFAVTVLLHEGVIVTYVPTAALVVVLATASASRRFASWDVVAVAAPPLAAAMVVAACGTVSKETAATMQANSPFPLAGTLFPYLDNSISDTVKQVTGFDHKIQLASLFVGGVLIVIQLAWTVMVVRSRPLVTLVQADPRWMSVSLCVVATLGVVATFATGIDWLRWCCIFAACYLVLNAVEVLSRRADHSFRERIYLPAWLPVAAVVLALLPPLPVYGGVGAIIEGIPFT